MFIVEIKFSVPAEHEPSEVEDTVWNLLAAWDKNGQIHDHYSLFAAPDGGLRALANIPEETALDDVHAVFPVALDRRGDHSRQWPDRSHPGL